jgi:hypothetical protein
MVAAVMVCPCGDAVLPLMPEMIRNESGVPEEAEISGKKSYGEQKQDCERKAVKRLLEKHGEYCKGLKAMLPGDSLYASHSTCKAVLDSGLSFIFTCRDESHPWIAE